MKPIEYQKKDQSAQLDIAIIYRIAIPLNGFEMIFELLE